MKWERDARGKLLIGLEVCRREAFAPCNGCQYGVEDPPSCFEHLAEDALAYIGWLEEQMEEKQMPKKMELCHYCAEKMKEGYRLEQLPRPANNKITCALCGRSRFGATYVAIIHRKKEEQ